MILAHLHNILMCHIKKKTSSPSDDGIINLCIRFMYNLSLAALKKVWFLLSGRENLSDPLVQSHTVYGAEFMCEHYE